MKRTYTITGFCIVFVWIVLMGVLVKRHYLVKPSVSFENEYMGETIESRDEWSGIYLMNKKVGYAHSEIQKIEKGYRIEEKLFLDMTIMDVPQKIETYINSVTDRNFTLSVFSFRLKSGVISFTAFGNVDEDTLKFRIGAGGDLRRRSLKLKDTPILSNSLKYIVLRNGLRTGNSFTRTFFDPMTLSNRNVDVYVDKKENITVHGRQYSCFKVRTTFKGVTMYSWVDENGDTIREESPMGLVLLKEDKKTAMESNWGDRPDVLEVTSIQVEKPFSTKGLKYLKVALDNIKTGNFLLNEGRQSLSGNILEIELEEASASDTYTLPYTGVDLKQFLEPTPFMPSDRDELKQLAAVVLQGETDAFKAALKLKQWVYSNLKKIPTMSIPNALEVIKTQQGDCNEHAVLMGALCRTAGIPAKMAAGLVYQNGRFYYHAWNEIYLKKWITVDATLNQMPADVTHIKFVEGGLDNQIAILELIGKLDLTVMEYL